MAAAQAEYDLAEAAFRASIEADRTVEALNSLAWVLQLRGRVAEASGDLEQTARWYVEALASSREGCSQK